MQNPRLFIQIQSIDIQRAIVPLESYLSTQFQKLHIKLDRKRIDERNRKLGNVTYKAHRQDKKKKERKLNISSIRR